MKSHHTRRFLPAALLAFTASLQAQPTYTGLTVIKPSSESTYSIPNAINASGQVLFSDGSGGFFLWSNGNNTQITNSFGEGWLNTPYKQGLNDSGQVTGYAEVGEDRHYFIWSSEGGMTEITIDDVEEVRGLTDSGQVFGNAYGEPNSGFVWNAGVTTMLASPTGQTAYAYAMNNLGQVAGTTYNGDGETVALRWEANGDATEIGILGMGYVAAINDSGHVAGGFVDMDTFSDKVFYWDGETMTFIDPLPGDDEGVGVSAINASGDIVGLSEGNDERAYLYTDGVMYDLNTLVAGFLVEEGGDTAGFINLEYAHDINDAGQIIGSGRYYDGVGGTYSVAFLLDNTAAIPEPGAAAALAGLGALGLAMCRRRRLR